ncbi:cysteine proteinase [Marasmius fiardii PR-910]|nr:cysteine proteinase [Marasmius fiardii PR-910]
MSASGSEDFEPCTHITTALLEDEELVRKYKKAVTWGVQRYQNGKSFNKKRKITVFPCNDCDVSLARPFFCLHCSYAGCWNNNHIVDHLKKADHLFCVDAKSGAIFCSQCDDLCYNAKADKMYLASVLSVEEKLTKFQVSNRPREPFKEWSPSEEESNALQGTVSVSCQGRRGLLNLGQTCFMNAVLQSFVHNPLLRNYFLGDKHNSKLCKTEDCMSCEMDKLFTEIYSDELTPFGPVSFLMTTWQKSPELSGYAQHDAHEFFCLALNSIHSSSKGSTNISCNCIIHSTFAGQLQSDVTCERCHNVTTTVDPMFDINLELKDKGNDGESTTLMACLRRYTQPERLGNKEYSCDKCRKATHDASKRLTIRQLPPVLTFQLKRFEHKTSEKSASARKLDSVIRFPASLNMMPFITYSDKDNFAAAGPEALYEYDLFAVINHEGHMNNGHYTTFARFQDEWYRFDDDKITHSTLGDCLKSSAYMCFYVKRHLEYKPHMTPGYVLTREAEAIREKEMEKEKEAARMKEVEDALLATV